MEAKLYVLCPKNGKFKTPMKVRACDCACTHRINAYAVSYKFPVPALDTLEVTYHKEVLQKGSRFDEGGLSLLSLVFG